MTKRLDLIKIRDDIIDYMKRIQQNRDFESLAARYARFTDILVRGSMISFTICGALPLFFPFYSIFVLNELLLPYGFKIPGTDENSHPGYEINYFHHFIQTVFTVLGVGSCIVLTVIFVVHVCLQMDVICVKLRHVNHQIRSELDDTIMQDIHFGEIIESHQVTLGYLLHI